VTRPRSRAVRFALLGLGLVLLGAVIAAAAFPAWWGHRSQVSSQALLRQAGVVTPHGSSGTKSSTATPIAGCLTATPTAPGDPSPSGVMVIPSLGLTAPVVEGLGDAVLDVAVGHDPASPWPGATGESVLEAHDVSFFSRIDQLNPGQTITWEAGCARTTFRVTGASVMDPGDPVPTPTTGTGIALVTCWPTDALWWTSKRYVVTASLVSTTMVNTPAQWPRMSHATLVVPAAPGLVGTGLGLDSNPVDLGTLNLTGTVSPVWSSSPAPLQAANAALQEYVAARRSVLAQNQSWWSSIAIPGVALPATWSESGALDVTIDVTGTKVNTVTMVAGTSSLELSVSGSQLLVAKASGL
jgi:sortase A